MAATTGSTTARAAPSPVRAAECIQRIRQDHHSAALVDRLVKLSLDGLALMYSAAERRFAFSHKRDRSGRWSNTASTSVRYTAMGLIGLAGVGGAEQGRVLGGSVQDVCGELVGALAGIDELGDVALTAWASARCHSPRAEEAYRQLVDRLTRIPSPPTVQLAWAVTALSVCRADFSPESLAQTAAERLLARYHSASGLFDSGAHRPPRHVACFADQVYPTQALAHYHARTGDRMVLEAATACARRICHLQGPAGQWWWHYDVRNGRVIEGYPVYSVHQDAMGPMALLDLVDVCDEDFTEPIFRSLRWLEHSPELGSGLFEKDVPVLWRKAARTDPGKLVRKVRAALTTVHPNLRFRWLDSLFPPRAIDYECRPYHLGWVLYTWCGPGRGVRDGA